VADEAGVIREGLSTLRVFLLFSGEALVLNFANDSLIMSILSVRASSSRGG